MCIGPASLWGRVPPVAGFSEGLHEEPDQCCIIPRRLFTSLVHIPTGEKNQEIAIQGIP